ncbi:hypothetical protein TEA_002201 [Camellia sinensis var. sinensis]|uniref:Uncharacterized protein n=1 Tax=Camellia sinensis var. sinensis TaxID=542762 RepID=A0A4S4DYQ8_CAMSN|nr:hypothetical protein TEA_002201 [Camellia sinensis var. sinensis]
MSKIDASAIIGRAISYNWLLKGTPPPVSSFLLLRSFSTIFTTPTSSAHPPPSSSVITNQRVKLSKTVTTHQCDSNFDDAFQGILFDIYTFNIAINCYCHLNQVHVGFSVFGCLFKRGFIPTVATFNTLINGLILEDKTHEAVELFKKLITSREIEPNVVMYGTIINGLCRIGNTIRAVSLIRIMEDGSYKPDTVVCNTIIDSFCKDRMVDDALKLFSKMNEQGIHRDVVTYTSLIHGLHNFGK